MPASATQDLTILDGGMGNELLRRSRNRTPLWSAQVLIDDPDLFSEPYDWFTYRARGRYLEHLEPWLQRFPRQQLLFVPSETLYADPAGTYAQVLRFIGLPAHDLGSYEVYNGRKSAPMDPAVRAELTEYYRPHNAALAQRLGMTFDWAGGAG